MYILRHGCRPVTAVQRPCNFIRRINWARYPSEESNLQKRNRTETLKRTYFVLKITNRKVKFAHLQLLRKGDSRHCCEL
jgi:uncharacterized protein (DUF2132 family)